MTAETAAPKHRHHFPRWLRRLLVGVIAVAALLALLPPAIRLGLERVLHQQGLEAVSIANIDLNLFTLRFRLEGLRAGHGQQPTLSIDQLQAQLAWRPLWHKQVVLQSLELRGANLEVTQQEDGRWHVGGIALPPPSPSTEGSSPRSAWGFGLQQLRIERASCDLTLPRLRSRIELNTLAVNDLYTWLPLQPTQLQLDGTVNGSPLSASGTATPLASVIDATAHLRLQRLALAPFLALAPPDAPALDAQLSVDSDFSYRGDAVVQQVHQRGTVAVDDVVLVQSPWRVHGKHAGWDGSVDLTVEQGELHALGVTGDVALDGAGVGDAGGGPPLLTLAGADVHGIALQGIDNISVAEVQLHGLQATLQRDARGHLLLPHAEAAAQPAPAKTANAMPALHIGTIVIDGDSQIEFSDRAVQPAYHQVLQISDASVATIDNRATDKPATFHLSGRTGKYTPLELRGEVYPFAAKTDLKLHSQLKGVELPQLTPYTVRYLGYDLTSGQLAVTSDLTIHNDVIEADNDLHIHKLTVQKTDPKKMAQFDDQLKIPLDTALYMLKDSDDNIALELPIKGNLNDPAVGISDIINTALGKTLKVATFSYLKLLLQPYSGLLTLASMANGMGGIQFQPIAFAPTLAVVEPQQQPYLAKIGELFKQRPKLQLRLCGIATAADRPQPPKGKKPPEEKEVTALLETLARQRAEAVKDVLVAQYGIAPEQLFVCQPAIDAAATTAPRVELLL